MPQYNGPALITQLLAADVLLVWQDSSSANKTITFADFVTSVEALFDKRQSASEVSVNTVLDDTYELVVVNSGGGITVTLPDALTYLGKTYSIVNKGAGTLTVARSGADTIGGATSVTMAQYKGYDFKAVASGLWIKMGA